MLAIVSRTTQERRQAASVAVISVADVDNKERKSWRGNALVR
jgi:hypothetical protein